MPESIEALRTSAYFTANSSIYNEANFEELEQIAPRDGKDEKSLSKTSPWQNIHRSSH